MLQSSVLVAVEPVEAWAPVAPSQFGAVALVPGNEWHPLQSVADDAVKALGASREALVDAVRRANPIALAQRSYVHAIVGRIVLRIAGYENEMLERSSDSLCTALQLTNFWQDLERDWQKGRR